jgi:rubrerythrin
MKEQVYDDILKRAIEGEIEAAKFYADVAAQSDNDYIKELFVSFSEEEKRHRQILTKFQQDPSAAVTFEKVPDFHVSETVEAPPLSMDMKPAEAIALAMKKEEAAMRQYNALADVCKDPVRKKIFLELAAMERGHKAKMETAFVDIGFPEVW